MINERSGQIYFDCMRLRNLPIYWLVKFIFGKDIEFLQFVARVKKL